MNRFAQNLRTLRRRQKLTQQQLADSLNIKRPTIGAYEEGRGKPDFNRLIEIADFLQVSIDDLLKTDFKHALQAEGW